MTVFTPSKREERVCSVLIAVTIIITVPSQRVAVGYADAEFCTLSRQMGSISLKKPHWLTRPLQLDSNLKRSKYRGDGSGEFRAQGKFITRRCQLRRHSGR